MTCAKTNPKAHTGGSVAIPGPKGGFWIYIVGPLLGGPLGAFLAEHLLWGDALENALGAKAEVKKE